MANTKNTRTAKNTKTVKEEKVMATKTTKKAVEVKESEVKAVKNEKKVDALLTIQEITSLYSDMGIKCHNPEGKGNYRIMGGKSGSSLNIVKRDGYVIYSTETDFESIKKSGILADDLKMEKGSNSQDKVRPNRVECKTLETLKLILAVYATNPLNKVA